MKRRLLPLLLLLAATLAGAEPDEQLLGKDQGYPVAPNLAGWYDNPYRVGSWSALDQVPGVRVSRVAASPRPRPLARMATPPPLRYRYRNIGYTLDEYLERQRATGLLILKDGQVVAERYRYGRHEDARFLSFSMAKSVTALLVGVALDKGLIASLDDPAQTYARELEGTAYGQTRLVHLLRMASGLSFSERYDGRDDVSRMTRAFVVDAGGTLPVLRSVADRHSPAGEKFVYASAETEVLGRVLRGATGRSLAELTQAWLWEPIGAEHEAFWRIGADGQEGAFAFFNASLRDWGRLGLLLARDGELDGRAIVSRDYLLQATDAARQPAAFRPYRATRWEGYGFQFWLSPLRARTFAMHGIHGQAVYVQPSSGVVMVLTSAWQAASGQQDPAPFQERDALWRGVLQSLGGSTD
ncbi:serine hydrolase [Ramlibacter tataouinensis]|uniref:serine hydrolase domain-containing protein n=1 Tax=Ramlibacter tataouinensis TaxID=94132 RepID=UPI0022F3F265|nr:serine hydrolase [Ramlibacter tataouinensis]WBX99994.1 serine hydrolase [Ramlibacter tataouinensis]